MSDAARVTRLLSILAVRFDAQGAACLLRLLHRSGLRDVLADFFGGDFIGFEVFAHPASHLFGDVGESLHGREPGCPELPHGHRAHGAERPQILEEPLLWSDHNKCLRTRCLK